MDSALLPERYPFYGVEFFERGILARTPVRGVPLPLHIEAHTEPPSDLSDMGMVALGVDADVKRFSGGYLPRDAMGFGNPRTLDRAEVLLVGDSFTLAMGLTTPPGLQMLFSQSTGLSTYNLGLAGIGPVREAWLLEHHGLRLDPGVVIWFFFGGNDHRDVVQPLAHEYHGRRTYGDVFGADATPRWILPTLVGTLLESGGDRIPSPLPGFSLRPTPETRLWFLPEHLRQLTVSEAQLEADLGWQAAQEAISGAAHRTRETGARFLLVFLPTKAQVYLPFVDWTEAELHDMATFDSPLDFDLGAEELALLALEHRADLEACVARFAAREGIAFLSATPGLEALAREGELGYFTCDTHWQDAGQRTLLDPLVEWVLSEQD